MKKTIITILAFVPCAFGVTYDDFTEFALPTTPGSSPTTANVTTTGFDFSSNAVTVALTLNADVLKGYFQLNSGSCMITSVTGNNAIGVGTLVKNGLEYFSGAWNSTIDYTPSGVDTDMGRAALWENVQEASLVFSADRTTGARVIFTLTYTDGKDAFQTSGTAGSVKSSGWVPAGLYVDVTAVESIAMYNSYITLEDAKSIGLDLATVPTNPDSGATIPEPTTATLSLLALAGLAARRRRK